MMKTLRFLVLAGVNCAVAGSVWAASHEDHTADDGHGMQHNIGVKTQAVSDMRVAPNVTTSSCWIRLLPGPSPSAGYFVLHNDSNKEVVLAGAQSDAFDDVMVHQTRHENGMSRMAMINEIPVPQGQGLEFKPGGFHLMLEQPSRSIQVGDNLQVTLILKSSEKVVSSCKVKPAGTIPGRSTPSP